MGRWIVDDEESWAIGYDNILYIYIYIYIKEVSKRVSIQARNIEK